MAPIKKPAPGNKRPVAYTKAAKTGEAKLRAENKKLREEVRGLKKGGSGDDKKESGPKESMKDKMARLRGMVGKKKK
jgi:cell division protein FtsB